MGTRKNAAAAAKAPDGYVTADKGYALGIRDSKLVCLSPKGQKLASVPKDVRESEAGEQLLAVLDFAKAHEREVTQTIETWMLRSLPTPTAVLVAVWKDETYRKALENLVVVPKGRGPGILRGVDGKKGIGLVDADGETTWSKVDEVNVPHPILLEDLEGLRTIVAELGLTQGQKQLFREIFPKPSDPGEQAEITTYRDGKFEMLMHARGAAKSLGYRTSGAWAICRIFENGTILEARFWLGDDDSDDDAKTGELIWVDDEGDGIPIAKVTPIAFSEGMRMASAIYGKRVVEKEGGNDE